MGPATSWVWNHSLASLAASSKQPGSSKRWPAPATTLIAWLVWRWEAAQAFSSSTSTSRDPTISSVGLRTAASTSKARSGRPPRDTIARTCCGLAAAARRQAAEPVLAPKSPRGKWAKGFWVASQSIAPTTRSVRSSISNRFERICSLGRSSSSVSRSKRSVASPPWTRFFATARLRGLWRLLPLPWAKTTRPFGWAGMASRPGSWAPTEGTTTCLVPIQWALGLGWVIILGGITSPFGTPVSSMPRPW